MAVTTSCRRRRPRAADGGDRGRWRRTRQQYLAGEIEEIREGEVGIDSEIADLRWRNRRNPKRRTRIELGKPNRPPFYSDLWIYGENLRNLWIRRVWIFGCFGVLVDMSDLGRHNGRSMAVTRMGGVSEHRPPTDVRLAPSSAW
ncbi:hypothetical protein Dimus_006007 [Dionaea muscipula]